MKKFIISMVLLSVTTSSFATGAVALSMMANSEKEKERAEQNALVQNQKTLSLSDSYLQFITKVPLF